MRSRTGSQWRFFRVSAIWSFFLGLVMYNSCSSVQNSLKSLEFKFRLNIYTVIQPLNRWHWVILVYSMPLTAVVHLGSPGIGMDYCRYVSWVCLICCTFWKVFNLTFCLHPGYGSWWREYNILWPQPCLERLGPLTEFSSQTIRLPYFSLI